VFTGAFVCSDVMGKNKVLEQEVCVRRRGRVECWKVGEKGGFETWAALRLGGPRFWAPLG
jgi:hypothetical protein